MTDTAYSGLSAAETIFKSLIWDNSVTAALNLLYAYVPWLNFWPIRPIINYIVKLFTDEFFGVIRKLVDLGAIFVVNELLKVKYDEADMRLRQIADEKGIDSDEFKKGVEADSKAFAGLVTFGK